MIIAFTYIDKEMLIKIIIYIRLKLKSAAVIWSPHLMKQNETAEGTEHQQDEYQPSER